MREEGITKQEKRRESESGKLSGLPKSSWRRKEKYRGANDMRGGKRKRRKENVNERGTGIEGGIEAEIMGDQAIAIMKIFRGAETSPYKDLEAGHRRGR